METYIYTEFYIGLLQIPILMNLITSWLSAGQVAGGFSFFFFASFVPAL
jgi:hypothetical protein